MTVIADLSRDRWIAVAKRVRITRLEDRWVYDLPPHEVSVLQIARQHGSVITHQKRDANGVMFLMAKLVRSGRPSRGPEAFAIAGREMFER